MKCQTVWIKSNSMATLQLSLWNFIIANHPSNDYFSLPPPSKSISATCESLWGVIEALTEHQLASRPAGVVMIFKRNRNAAAGDLTTRSTYCFPQHSSREHHYFLDSICSALITRELRGPKMAGCSILEFSFVSSESGA